MPNAYPVKNPPHTLVKSSHGLQIKVNGRVIGSISRWTPAPIDRRFTQVYELNVLSSGHPIDNVPQNLGGYTITVTRADIWKEPFEKAFGGNIDLYEAIGRQDRPFEVYQYFYHPDGYVELIVWRGCWFSRVGRDYSSTGDRIVLVNAELTFLRRDRIM